MTPEVAAQKWIKRHNNSVGPMDSNFDTELDNFLFDCSADDFLAFLDIVTDCELRGDAIGLLGAGPVEFFLHNHSGNLTSLETLLQKKTSLRQALSCALCDEDTPENATKLYDRFVSGR